MVLLSYSIKYGFYYYEPETDAVYISPFSIKTFDYWFTPGVSIIPILLVLLPPAVMFYGLINYNWDYITWILVNVLTCGFLFGSSLLCRMKIRRSLNNREKIILSEAQLWELGRIYKAADAMGLSYFKMRGLGHSFLFIFFIVVAWRVTATIAIGSEHTIQPSAFWPMVTAVLEMALYPLLSTQERQRKKCMQRIIDLIKERVQQHKSIHNMDSTKCAEQIISSIPQAKSIYENHFSANGRLILDLFLVEILTDMFYGKGELSESQTQTAMQMFKIIEDMWRYGDDDVSNAACNTALEVLASNKTVWKLFCESVSDEFLNAINTEIMPNEPNL